MERFCACAANGTRQSASALKRCFIRILLWSLEILPHAQALQRLGSSLLRRGVDLVVEARSVAVHGNDQGPEAVDTELPQRLRVKVVEIHVLDSLDPRRLERGRAADDREIGAAELFKSL